jgi:asparagine synthase (glutamine-hydrolysing)
MCGIFGFWLKRPLSPDDIELGRRGTQLIGHRGPDGSGEWFDRERGIFLGHRRLAIIDVNARSDQPMVRGKNVIIYNGEVYNFSELRDELKSAGDKFVTTGDTEVLLAAWARWGEQSLDRFDAMFAFALIDNDDLVLATDPFGEKPLYIARTDDGIWFSSEPQPLIDILQLKFKPDHEDIALFLSLGFLPPPRTGFPELEVMRPATLRRYHRDLSYSERAYWRLPHNGNSGKSPADLSEQNVDDVAQALITSLKRRLRSDVPIGLFLSSGIDSSLVAALCARELQTPLTAYTVSFADGFDEAPAAAKIAAHLGLTHTIIDSRESVLNKPLPSQLAELYGVPNDNLSGLSVQQMSQLARSHVTVALSGAGGDELSFGYNKYQFLWRRRAMYRLPSIFFQMAALLKPFFQSIPRLKQAADYLAGDQTFRLLSVKNGGFASAIRDISSGLPSLPVSGEEIALASRALDVELTLPGSYLSAIDRGSMRAALEVRTPFLSRDVFAKAAAIDGRTLIAAGQKALLRRILKRYLPDSLTDFPKRGFVSPIDRYVSTLREPPRKSWEGGAGLEELWVQRANPSAANILLRIDILRQWTKAA